MTSSNDKERPNAAGNRLTALRTSGYLWPAVIALVFFCVLMITAGNYGMFRDEFYYAACGEHLDFGYVDQPPMIAIVAKLTTMIFGHSLLALRFWPALAGLVTVLLTAALAKELGGGKFAMAIAALLIPGVITLVAQFGFFSMNAFDPVFISLCALLFVRILNGASPRLWLWFGVVAGLGLQNKMTPMIFGFAAVIALVFSQQRKQFLKPWLYIGGAIALVIFLPNVIWQIVHGFPTLEFMDNAMNYKNINLSVPEFFGQLIIGANPGLLPFWLGGIVFFFVAKERQTTWVLGLLFVLFLGVYLSQHSKFYYVIPIFPLLLAAGAVGAERLTSRFKPAITRTVVLVYLLVGTVALMPMAIPILDINTFASYSSSLGLMDKMQMENHEQFSLPQHFADRFGWKEMVEDIAAAYDTLSESEKAKTVILTGNYGQAGALDWYGGAFGLPKATCIHNNYWVWGPGDPDAEVYIVYGISEDFVKHTFSSYEHAGVHVNRYAMPYESNRTIFICRGIKRPLAELWPELKNFV